MTARLHDLIVVGAGPAGMELGLAAAHAGLDVLVLERGEIAENMRRWGFVTLFSPWSMNTTELGRAHCGSEAAADAYLSGLEFRDLYWLPLSRSSLLEGRVRQNCTVRSVGRAGAFKHTHIGDSSRSDLPFHVLLDGEAGEELLLARNVADASGVYGNPKWVGAGGIPALGERRLSSEISRELVDFEADPTVWSGRRLLLVGAGYSACSALEQLARLRAAGVDVHVHWAHLVRERAPVKLLEDDPLPYRRRLGELANRLAAEPPAWLRVHSGCGVESLHPVDGEVEVGLQGVDRFRVDHVLALVGYRPDWSLCEELQFHECWATSGPMKLSAALLAQTGSADCLSIGDTGAETLLNPEPGFFVLGAKSYGRNPDFLMQRAHAQVESVLGFVRDRLSSSAQ